MRADSLRTCVFAAAAAGVFTNGMTMAASKINRYYKCQMISVRDVDIVS